VVKQPTRCTSKPKNKKGFGHKNQEKNNGEFIHHHVMVPLRTATLSLCIYSIHSFPPLTYVVALLIYHTWQVSHIIVVKYAYTKKRLLNNLVSLTSCPSCWRSQRLY